MNTIAQAHAHAQTRPLPTRAETTRLLLTCGTLAGPVFVGSSLLQALIRPGFNLTRHAISLLMLGDAGWIQIATFELAGLLAIAGAVGAWRVLHPGRAGTWGPLLVGGYGLGLLIAGIFAPDPAFAFPPGTPDVMPTTMSGHGAMHAIGFFVSMISLVAGGLAFARRFMGLHERAWAAYSAASGVATPALILLSIFTAPRGGIAMFGLALVTAGWITAVFARLLVADRTR